jgi:hypothetical protein
VQPSQKGCRAPRVAHAAEDGPRDAAKGSTGHVPVGGLRVGARALTIAYLEADTPKHDKEEQIHHP